jgi:acetoin utilization deacetylase AcuC-like enzyme
MSRRLFYCDNHEIPLPPGHKFPITKYQLIRNLLEADGVFELCPAPFAERKTIELAHDPQYVDEVFRGALPEAAIRRIGFPWSEGLVRRTLASVGGTLSATQDALQSGWGGNLAGGTHHAFRAAGSGFCVFNDFAIAIHWLRSQGKLTRAAIVDLDVHQGDGTAEIFSADSEVLTASMHCKSNFPFRKQQSSIDIDLRDATTDEEYLNELDMLVPQIFTFEPQIIFYQSGVDGLRSDSIGRLALSHEGLKERDRRVVSAAKCHSIPLVITLGGGYSVPIELTAEAHANTYRTAAEIFT